MKRYTCITSHYISFIVMQPIFLFLIAIVFNGCGPIYYVPNTQNVPIMKEKGQMNLSLGFNGSEYTDGFELQGAFGISDSWALQLNTDWVNSSEDSSSGSGNFVEIGGGYYKSLTKSVVFETYGLLGYGSMDYKDYFIDNSSVSANFYRVGIQPSISFVGKYFNTSLSSRLATINYTNVRGTSIYDINYLTANNSFWLLEPALTLQGGPKNIKLQLQFQLSYNLTVPDFSQDYSLISLGLKVNLDTKK